MKKNTFVRIIPDLSFLLLSSLITVSLFRDVDISVKYFLDVAEIFFILSFSILFSFFVFKVYSRQTFTFKSKLNFPIRGYFLGLAIISLISFVSQNNFIDLNYIFFKNLILVAEPDIFFNLAVISWLFSFVLMILVRSWIYLYAKTNESEIKSINIEKNKKNVLIIGGAGYIGSALVKRLLDLNYKVNVLDILFFGNDPISPFLSHPNFNLIRADFRKIDDLVISMQNCHSVIHLGGLVGDPACAIDENLTTEVNLTSTKILGTIAKAAGVQRFIFASSCSVYGDQDGILDESSDTKPLSLYAKTKIASEKVLQDLASNDFSPVILRFGTVFGLSGRTRFDLVVNLLTAKAFVEKNMTVFGANQNRPFIHVDDAANAIVSSIIQDKDKVHNEIFNIGSDNLNFNLLEVAKLIKLQVPDSEITVEERNEDARNYKVSFEKASNILNFKNNWTLEEGIAQVVETFKQDINIDYQSNRYSNVLHMSEEGRDLLGSLEYSGWEKDLLDAQV
ncbi:MAG: NAD(P)-dependent oxidoreductase [Pseudomonadota bacterium]|nr:NAD(P)-dependent oxidoreductase [Pseudomonadota bacterium]